MVCTPTRHGRWEPANQPMLRKYSQGTFCNFPRNHASANATVRQKVPRPTFRNFSSSCRMLLQQRIQRFSTSAKFPQDFPQNFPRSFRRTFRKMFPQTFRRTIRTKLPLDSPQGFRTDACRELLPKSLKIQCAWLGLECYEDPLPCRIWFDKPFMNRCSQQSHRKLSDRFPQGPLGAPSV